MRLRLCTWNVNSVRLRAEQAARFVAEQAPDVLCMQEIKCQEGEFPAEAFVRLVYGRLDPAHTPPVDDGDVLDALRPVFTGV